MAKQDTKRKLGDADLARSPAQKRRKSESNNTSISLVEDGNGAKRRKDMKELHGKSSEGSPGLSADVALQGGQGSRLSKSQRRAIRKAQTKAAEDQADSGSTVQPKQQPNTERDTEGRSSKREGKDHRKQRQSTARKDAPSSPTTAQASRVVTAQVSPLPKAGGEDQHTTQGVGRSSDIDSRRPAWTLSATLGGRFLPHDPVFVVDANGDQYLVTSNGREMQLWSLESSLLVHLMPAPADHTITAFCKGLMDPDSIYVAFDDSTTSVWKWAQNEMAPARRYGGGWHKHRTIESMAVADDGESQRLYRIDRKGSHWSISNAPYEMYTTSKYLIGLMIFGASDFAVAYGPKVIIVGRRQSATGAERVDFEWIELPMNGKPITCADARLTTIPGKKGPAQHHLSLALGNAEGQIHLYDDVTLLFQLSQLKKQPTLPSPRILHWHRDAVSSIKFSKDGNYLVSGGKETVLVLWQLATGKQQFLPHLTSEIERIVMSPLGDRYALQMGDNSIIVLSTAELKAVAAFGGLQLPTNAPSDVELWAPESVAATLHPQRPNELLLTVPSSQPKTVNDIATRPFLQTFDIHNLRHVSRQALTRNNVTDFNLGPERTPIVSPDVNLLALSFDGRWMASVDEWTPPPNDVSHLAAEEEDLWSEMEHRREVHLKIWQWREEKGSGSWVLEFRVDAPHTRANASGEIGAGRVLSLVANPSADGFATAGEDGMVRLWAPRRTTKGTVTSTEWRCMESICLERTTESEKVDSPVALTAMSEEAIPDKVCLAWSADGSMLAAAQVFDDSDASQTVHFVDSRTGDCILRQIPAGVGLNALGFVDRHLIALSENHVLLWDLVADEVKKRWDLFERPARTSAAQPILAVNHQGDTFAVAMPEETGKRKPSIAIYSGIAATKQVARLDVHSPVVSLMAVNQRSSYVAVFEDATIRTLDPRGSGAMSFSLPGVSAEEQAKPAPPQSAAYGEAEVETSALSGKTDNLSHATNKLPENAVAQQDDRPVVRPEQLAGIFDVPAGTAIPGVRDMFSAIVGLYGRKPVRALQTTEV